MKSGSPICSKRSLFMVLIMSWAVALQIAAMFFVLSAPDKLFWVDPHHYYNIAKTLYEGGPYSVAGEEYNIYRSPGYPFVLSMIMRLTGTSVVGIRFVHIALFPVFLLVLYRLGTVIVNRGVGILTMLLAALYPLYIYIPLTLYPESLLIYLFALAALLLYWAGQKRNPLTVLALGATISLAVMMRPTAVVWIPVSLFYLLRRNRPTRAYVLKLVLILVILPAVCVASWMLRNYHVHGCTVFSTAGSINLLYGYNEQSTWKSKSSVIPTTGEFEKETFRTKTLAEKEKLRLSTVRNFIKDHPGRALSMAFLRCLDLWNPIPRTTTEGGMAHLKFKIANALVYVFFLALGVAGFWGHWKNPLVKILLLLIILNTLANGIVGVSVRYRAVTDFGFILMAAAVVNSMMMRLRERTAHAKDVC